MIRGTTEIFKFDMPYNFTDFCVVEAIFWQKGNLGTEIAPLPIIKIYDTQVTPVRNDGIGQGETPNEIVISLTPEETLRFSDQMKGYAQIQAYCDRRHITIGSKEQRFAVYPMKNEELIGQIGIVSPDSSGAQILDAGDMDTPSPTNDGLRTLDAGDVEDAYSDNIGVRILDAGKIV